MSDAEPIIDEIKTKRPPKMKMDYTDFLNTITCDFEVLRLRDAAKTKADHACFLRHDVDFRIEWALELAEMEHDAGVHSSYYVLHTMPYFYQDDFVDICKQIQDMGHEIGIHNSIISECISKEEMSDDDWNRPNRHYEIGFPDLTVSWDLPESCVLYGHNCYTREPPVPVNLLKGYLKKLRSDGLDIVGTAAHGNRHCKELKFQPYHLFKDCGRHYWPEPETDVPLHEKTLGYFGLEYEAYFIKQNYYLTDGQLAWHAFPPKYDEWCPNLRMGRFVKDPLKVIKELGGNDDAIRLQLNTHPIWWFVDVRKAVKKGVKAYTTETA